MHRGEESAGEREPAATDDGEQSNGTLQNRPRLQAGRPDEVRIYRDGQHIGDIFKHEDILDPGRFHYLIWLAEDWRGWKRVTERSRLRETAQRWVETHPLL